MGVEHDYCCDDGITLVNRHMLHGRCIKFRQQLSRSQHACRLVLHAVEGALTLCPSC